jgi:hypothetical protein
MKEWGIKFSLPEHLAEKAASFPESSYGATVLTLVLKDGTRVPHSRGGTRRYKSHGNRRGVFTLHAKSYENRGCLARVMKPD